MNTVLSLHLSPGRAALLFLGLAALSAQAIDSRAVKRLFKDPPREYSTAPLWVWNDLLTEDQIRGTLRDLAGQDVKQVFVHPRPGLMTPYLGPDWFRLWKTALQEAKRLDMNVWIYDENSYPSGFAGGWVPEFMPESRGQGLSLQETKTPPTLSTNLVGVYRLEGDSFECVTAKVRAGATLPEARYLVASQVQAGNSPWHGNRCYVNLLSPGVTEKFLEVTLDAYRREIGDQFGKRVPGVFTDEPNIRPAGGFPWCEDLPEQFQKRWGYSLLDHLPSLAQPVGDWKKIRHNYFSTLNDLFIERWAKPFYEWCDRHNLEFTGHYWDHEWPHCIGVPDNMAMAAWQHRPGVDTLMNQYAEHTHAQFGNVRYCREISSLANQLGRKRTLVELYGAGGWDLRFEDMKRIGDWLQVLGINTLDEHLSYITLRGARKRDHPQSFSSHEPWWDAYHLNARYMSRLSCALSQGEQINRILVLEPTTTAWMYQGDEPRLRQLGDAFSKFLMALENAQVEYDLACENVIARLGRLTNPSTGNRELVIGNRSYKTVFLAFAENLDSRTADLLLPISAKAPILLKEPPPARTDGAYTGDTNRLPPAYANDYPAPTFQLNTDFSQALAALPKPDGFSITRAEGDKGILFHHRRHLDDGQILFLVNTSIESPSSGTLRSDLKGVEQWNLHTGRTELYPFETSTAGVQAHFHLPPSGSLLLFLSKKALPPPPPRTETRSTLAASAPLEIRRLEPNVLTLDYVDITAGGESRTNLYFYAANQFAWQKNGLDRNPWDSAVQFKDELISRKFPAQSGFTARYRFTLDAAVPSNLVVVIERPDLYTITCNDQPVTATQGDWWLDKAFGRIHLASVARPGENIVTLQAAPFTMFHELEPAYVLGDFTLRPAPSGFALAPDQTLTLGQTNPPAGGAPAQARLGWNRQGHPFYSAGVAYRQTFNLARPSGRYFVSLPNWYGSLAKVLVNGKPSGHITAPPWECEVTKHLKRGPNTIEVTVVGTLKNTLGPHHGNHPLGSAWPAMFQNGPKTGPPPGHQYATVSYGLFEPFQLHNLAK